MNLNHGTHIMDRYEDMDSDSYVALREIGEVGYPAGEKGAGASEWVRKWRIRIYETRIMNGEALTLC